MIDKESEIRHHLKTLTNEDIANSVLLVGTDFDNTPIDTIMNSIMQLILEVINLKNIYDNFRDEPKVLSPVPRVSHDPKNSSEYRRIITEEYYRKNNALSKIVANKYIYDEVVNRMALLQSEEEGIKL